jgi:hypothetical protein
LVNDFNLLILLHLILEILSPGLHQISLSDHIQAFLFQVFFPESGGNFPISDYFMGLVTFQQLL